MLTFTDVVEDKTGVDILKKISKNGIVVIIIVLAAIAGVATVYFIGKNNYKDKFFPGTTINGWDCSGETVEEVKANLQDEVEQYTLTIVERGGNVEEITGKELGLVYEDNGEVDAIFESQNSSLWFMNLGGNDYTVETAFQFENLNLSKTVNKLDCFKEENVVEPQDAVISYQDGAYVIIPETEGNKLNKDMVYEAVKTAVKQSEESINLEEIGAYIQPTKRSTDESLNNQVNQLNLMLSASLTYDFVDSKWVCDREVIYSCIQDDGTGTLNLNRDALYQWVADMAYETDTFGLKHKFMTSYGVEIELEAGGDYGWCIDKDATTDALYQYITAGQNAVIQPEYLYTALDRSSNDIGDTYVEVCIEDQTLWCYYDGELITTTPVITGNESLGYNTPSGSVWAIDGKKDDWTFTHFPDSHSDFWMPFNGECGLHDATWRPIETYTKTEFKTNGSHGCVNMPYEPMKKIYEYMEIGYPVVVYYSVDQVAGPGPTQELIAG